MQVYPTESLSGGVDSTVDRTGFDPARASSNGYLATNAPARDADVERLRSSAKRRPTSL